MAMDNQHLPGREMAISGLGKRYEEDIRYHEAVPQNSQLNIT